MVRTLLQYGLIFYTIIIEQQIVVNHKTPKIKYRVRCSLTTECDGNHKPPQDVTTPLVYLESM